MVDEENDDTEEVEEEEEEQEENDELVVKLCKTCRSGGEVIDCDKCSSCYHIECVEPPLRRAPRGPWFCMNCKGPNDRKRHYGEYKNSI